MLRWVGGMLCALATAVSAQTEEDAEELWKHKLVAGLNANQVVFKDWAQGGENALSWGWILEGRSARDAQRTNWTTTYKFALGHTRQGSKGIRKNTDKIDLESTLTYKVGRYVNPYVATTLKTQFLRGYKYAEKGRRAVSAFVDPLYLTQGAGAGFAWRPQIKTRFGLAMRQIFTRDFNSFTDRQSTARVESFRFNAGFESVTESEWKLADNILLNSKVEIFAPLPDIGETSLSNDNALNVKVSRYVVLNVHLQIVQDETAGDELQIKQATALGLSYSFF